MLPRPGESHWPLVFFTVLTQAAAGTAAMGAAIGVNTRTVPLVSLALLVAGALAAVTHLGRPGAARLALANLGSSWLSREAGLAAVFGASLVLASLVPDLVIVPAVTGLLLVGVISRLYMIRTVPAWNTWMTPAAFFGTTVLLGAAGVAVLLILAGDPADGGCVRWLGAAAAATAGVLILLAWLRRRVLPDSPAHVQVRRLLSLALGSAILVAATWTVSGPRRPAEAAAACAVLLLSEFMGRFLLYASHRRIGL